VKVVLDTNVFISSFMGGKPRAIIDLWKNGEITWCLSAALLDEYVEVLHRLHFYRRPETRELLRLFRRGVHVAFAKRTPSLKVVQEDADDNKLLECARALHANMIVTGDKVVLRYHPWKGISIRTPEQFMQDWK
jgi:putative PIN family toxin of toxin-antitoxin system